MDSKLEQTYLKAKQLSIFGYIELETLNVFTYGRAPQSILYDSESANNCREWFVCYVKLV